MKKNNSLLRGGEAQYRRGSIMGLTVAESFMLITFTLLMLLALWLVEEEKLSGLTQQDRAVIAEAFQEGVDVVDVIKDAQAQLDPNTEFVTMSRAHLDKIKSQAKLVEEEPNRQIAEAVTQLHPDTKRRLTHLTRNDKFEENIRRFTALNEVVGSRTPQEVSNDLQFADHAKEKGLKDDSTLKKITGSLRNAFGADVADMDGQIKSDGTIILPDRLLFHAGESEISEKFARALERICPSWLSTLHSSKRSIDEIRIEGHASREWRKASSKKEAFGKNLDLSQRRALAVLMRCLDYNKDSQISNWAREHLTAIGYSSSRPVMVNGRENAELSRRVEFRFSIKSTAKSYEEWGKE